MARQLIDREIFFGNPEIAGGKLSPDGQFIAFMKAYDGIMNLHVKGVEESFEAARILTKSKSPILGYFWSYDSKYILFVNDSDGDENMNIFSLDPRAEEPTAHNLTPLKEVRASIYKVSRKDPCSKIMSALRDGHLIGKKRFDWLIERMIMDTVRF